MNAPASLHQLLRHTATHTRHLNDTFLLQKKEGIYQHFSYAEVLQQINAVSAWLVEKGFSKGDRVAMILENCPEYIIYDQALMQIGAVNVSIYPTLPESDIAYILKDSGARAILVGTSFLLKKVLKATEFDTTVHYVFTNFEKPAGTVDGRIISVAEVITAGTEMYHHTHDAIEQLFRSVQREDIATLIYTSGTMGIPKGVMLTHDNFLSNATMARDIIQHLGPTDRFLSFLPLCHVYERLATYYLSTLLGSEIAFAQNIDTIASNILEVKPTVMATVPRLLERIQEKVVKNALGSDNAKAKIFNWALAVGEKRRLLKEAGKGAGPVLGAQLLVAEQLVFSKIKAKLGGRMRLIVSGGASLPQHVAEFFGNIGVRVSEGYGLTETSPFISVNEFNRQIPGTVGRVAPLLQVGILSLDSGQLLTTQVYDSFDPGFSSNEGEIVVKGPSVMKGYWNKPEDTHQVIDADGWFHTGDIGRFHKGYLKITDRLKNMLVNAYGKNIYPAPVENVYLKSPKIEQIFLVGDKREYITAIVVPSKEALQEQLGLQEEFFTRNEELIAEEAIRKWVEEDIKKLSNELAKFERIKGFLLKRRPFTVESGELTPTLKTKRKVIEKNFGNAIDALYESIGSE